VAKGFDLDPLLVGVGLGDARVSWMRVTDMEFEFVALAVGF